MQISVTLIWESNRGLGLSFDPTSYLTRVLDAELDELLPALAAIAVEGAKGVGKTATARRRATSVVQLDEPGQRAIAEADPAAVLQRQAPLLLDEWQRVRPSGMQCGARSTTMRPLAGSR